MHTIDDLLFEETEKKLNNHRLFIAFVAAEGGYDGRAAHKEAVICAMTSRSEKMSGFNPYHDVPTLTLNTALMECEPVSVCDFFRMCKVTPGKYYGRGKAPQIIDYADGYEDDESYSVGMKKNT